MEIARGKEEGGERDLLFTGHRISVGDDEKILELDGGDGGTTVWMYLMPLNCTLKNGRKGKFYVMCILAQVEIVYMYTFKCCLHS